MSVLRNVWGDNRTLKRKVIRGWDKDYKVIILQTLKSVLYKKKN